MLRVLRITLMWLIALAVPVQGSAAVTMFACGPGHHGESQVIQTEMAHENMPLAEQHSAAIASDEIGSHHRDGAAQHDHADSLELHGTAHKVAKGNCTPCASCCVVAGLPATVIQFEPVPLVDFFVPSTQSAGTTFLPDGLERPPRLVLA
ncbi:hypothetical protein BH11PSE8_BH11PSE8_12540 [soil metagenome]